MSNHERIRQDLIAKFRPYVARAGGGVFTPKTRGRLLGTRGLAGRDRTKSDFWYDQRNRVKNALADLELFIQTADKEQVNAVLTRETLEPVIYALFSGLTVHADQESNPTKADIANMLIRLSFQYLREKAREHITLSHERTIDEAVDLSAYLLSTIKGTPYSGPEHIGL